MLEAALKGNTGSLFSQNASGELADFNQHQILSSIAPSSSSRTGHRTEVDEMQTNDRGQHQSSSIASDQPHVLAWLEKGHSLFDEDGEDVT